MSHSWGDIRSLEACGVLPVTTDFPGNSIENCVDMHYLSVWYIWYANHVYTLHQV